MPELVAPALPPDVLSRRPQPTLRGDALVLRPWAAADTAAVVEAYADPDIQQWHGRSLTPEEADDWVASWAVRWAAGTEASWAIVAAGDSADLAVGLAVGRMAFKHIVPEAAVAEAAYWVAPSARGRGIAPAAVRLGSQWLFSLGFQRLELVHSVANRASCRVAEKAGYAFEGVRRRAGLHADGWHDMHLHAVVAPAA